MLTRIARTAAFSGLLAAIFLAALQALWVTPLIVQAEVYEEAAPHSSELLAPGAAQGEHQHDEEGWHPSDGLPRTLFTTLADLVIAVGFALMLAGIYALRPPKKVWHGLLWGLAGFATFSLAPALGLPPEVPGSEAAPLYSRQIWWLTTALSTAVGLSLLVFSRNWKLKALAVLFLVMPHLLGAPQPEHPGGLAPESLAHAFIGASLLTNGLFWAALGLLTAWFFGRPDTLPTDNADQP